MGKFVNCCAGAFTEKVLPGRNLDGLLLNVPHSGKNQSALNTTKKALMYGNPESFILDSGGYQFFMGEQKEKHISFDDNKPLIINEKSVNITPRHVVDTTKIIHEMTGRMTYSDILIMLDYPLQEITEPRAQEVEFRKKLPRNVEFAIKTTRLKNDKDLECRLFLPIQCYNQRQLDEFLNMLGNTHFDGVCTPLRNYTMMETMEFLIRFHKEGFRQIHLLAVGNFPYIALGAYLARHYFDWFSVDSTTWRHNSFGNKYLNPHNLRWISYDELPLFEGKIRCECPWCQYTTFAGINNLPKTERHFFLMRHNYWNSNRAAQVFFNESGTLLSLSKYLQTTSIKASTIDNIIDCLSEADLNMGN